MKGICRGIDVDVILEKYYEGCKYKATTWYLKKKQNAPRPYEHPLVEKNRGNVVHHQAWYYRNGKIIPFYTTPIGNFIQYC